MHAAEHAVRDALARHDWAAAFDAAGSVSVDTPEQEADRTDMLAEAAWWLGRLDDCIAAREVAYRIFDELGDRRRAGQCAVWLYEHHAISVHPAIASGWLRRGPRRRGRLRRVRDVAAVFVLGSDHPSGRRRERRVPHRQRLHPPRSRPLVGHPPRRPDHRQRTHPWGEADRRPKIALQVIGRAGVPGDADAVVLNVTVNEPDLPGFITASCNTPRPNASNLSYTTGQTIPNTVVTKTGTNGQICLYSDQTIHLIADVNGAF